MRIVIIGSGIAGITFAEKFRALNLAAEIILLTKETDGYYSRPILSHGFSKQDIEKTIIMKTFAQLEQNGIHINAGVEVITIDREQQSVSFNNGSGIEKLDYDQLVLAQGSAAFIPPPFLAFRKQFYVFNSLTDLKVLRKLRQSFIDQGKSTDWAIIGGGLIGCELASDLNAAGDQVTVYHAMDRLMERQLVAEDSALLLNHFEALGVDIRLDQAVQGFEQQAGKTKVLVANTSENSDHHAVIISCGFKPRTDLAQDSGLATGRGITVNDFLQTSDENIYALGDVAQLPNENIYAFIMPIRSQALWLAAHLNGDNTEPWSPPIFKPKAKIHGFTAEHAYIF
ncbi:NAD(P)/FAD-dependent oxidoreductase [Methyloprofundus sp.]|uniref:NAD(P)/FAD-dependent oxidoreductase n=1 Tax=Methyloprofundus sp. TaxID=2020875 RepID=UPI003D13525F